MHHQSPLLMRWSWPLYASTNRLRTVTWMIPDGNRSSSRHRSIWLNTPRRTSSAQNNTRRSAASINNRVATVQDEPLDLPRHRACQWEIFTWINVFVVICPLSRATSAQGENARHATLQEMSVLMQLTRDDRECDRENIFNAFRCSVQVLKSKI